MQWLLFFLHVQEFLLFRRLILEVYPLILWWERLFSRLFKTIYVTWCQMEHILLYIWHIMIKWYIFPSNKNYVLSLTHNDRDHTSPKRAILLRTKIKVAKTKTNLFLHFQPKPTTNLIGFPFFSWPKWRYYVFNFFIFFWQLMTSIPYRDVGCV